MLRFVVLFRITTWGYDKQTNSIRRNAYLKGDSRPANRHWCLSWTMLNPIHALPLDIQKIKFNIILQSASSSTDLSLPLGFPAKSFYTLHISPPPMCVIWKSHLILLDFIILITLSKSPENKALNYVFFFFEFPRASSDLDLNVPLGTLFSNTLSLFCCSTKYIKFRTHRIEQEKLLFCIF